MCVCIDIDGCNDHALRWSLIAGRLPGRTDNEVKNYWNSHLKKKLMSKGTTDPVSHFLRKATVPHHQPAIVDSCHHTEKFSDRKVTSGQAKTSELPDLNLNLSSSNLVDERLPWKVSKIKEENIDGNGNSSPTLLLFR
ncbi:hypothetical protein U1Q18_038105 [Sarracenia purpurea var. burkii]